MEPPDRGRGRGRGRGGRKSGSQQYGRGRISLSLSEYPTLGESSSQSKQKTAKEAFEQGPQYVKKNITEPLITLSEGDLNLHPKDPWCLKERYLQNQQYTVQEGKSRYIYEAILTETSSVQITHHYLEEGNSRTPITFSKCYIIRVMHPQEWGLSTFATRTLKINEQKYNYWDYARAWTYAFYYQNPVRTHSWFFIMNPEIVQKETGFPSWFLHWWEYHAPEIEIFPESIQKQFPVWYKYHPKLKGITAVNPPEGQDLLWFCTEFRINWIWQWGYEIAEDHLRIPEVQRNFFVKWWSRFETDKCLSFIKETVEQYQADYMSQVSSSNPSQGPVNFIQQIKMMIHNQNPNLSEHEQDIKLMEIIKDQYLATQGTSSSQTDAKSDISMSSQDQDQGQFTCLAGESQDPNDDTEVYPTEADLWDSMIELKMLKGKEKKKNR